MARLRRTPAQMAAAKRAHERRVIKTYGLLPGEYDRRLEEQGGVCQLCHKKPGRVRLVVDHDHQTQRVRGLIHSRCNRSLAPFESDNGTIARLIAYLQAILKDRSTARG